MSPPRRSSRSYSRSRIAFFVLSLVVVSSLAGGRWFAEAVRDEDDSLYKYLSTFTEVLSLIRQAYVDDTDLDRLMVGALDGTTEALDPFSLYVPADRVEGFLAARERGSRLSGLTLLKERGIAFVVAVEAGSPAAEAGIVPGDLVTEIDGRSTRVMPLWEVQQLMAGEPGRVLDLELIRRGEEISTSFALAAYDAALATWQPVGPQGDRVAELRVNRFETGTAERVAAALAAVREAGLSRLLVDLRDIAGGDTPAAYEVAGLFTSGELGRLVQRGETIQTFEGGERPAWEGRIVVLVNRGTLGAAEVLAKVLRQRADAELVGETTFGHAGRQEEARLSSGRLFFTSAFYTGPDGAPLDEGLEPDESVDLASRGYEEREVPLSELIHRRGLERLRGVADEGVARAA